MLGRTVSHYRILEEIGSGGMGVVYRAEDTRIGVPVALKFLPDELTADEPAKRRFVREAQASFTLDHPNICNIHEIDETEDGQLFICMSYYTGESLRERLVRGPLLAVESMRIAIGVASGLARAHAEGVVHRDIKPANILITDDGEVKILDFGLAKLAGRSRVTRTGTSLGTVAYMSPEQVSNTDVDTRSDIFSLGAVLYELLTGRAPFAADNPAGLVYRILNDEPAPLRESCPDCPTGLQRVVDKALRKDVHRRYQTIDELKADLERILQGVEPRARRTQSTGRMRRPLTMAATIALVALVVTVSPGLRDVARRWLPWPGAGQNVHLTVLPFENVGGDPTNQVFCDGLMQTLTSKLTQLEQFQGSFWVVPASEVRQRGIASATEAAAAFGVNLAVTGSIQSFGDRIRLTINLVSMRSDTPRQLNSWVTDIGVTEIAMLQDQTVMQLASMLDVGMAAPAMSAIAAGNTNEPHAFDAYVRGQGYLQHIEEPGNLDLAIESFDRAIAEDPAYALAYAGLGEAYWIKYEVTKDQQWIAPAIENCERAAGLQGDLAPVQVSLGLVDEGMGYYEEALDHFSRALELDPASVAAYRGLASTYSDLGRIDEAESTYLRAIESKPDFWAVHNDLGRFYYQHGRYDDAATQFREVARLTPRNVWAWTNLGAVLYYLEHWDEAAGMFRRSIEIQPTMAAYSNLATIEYIRGDYTESARMSLRSLEIDDQQYEAWTNLANAYHWLPGRQEDSLEGYRRAREVVLGQLKINPRDAELLAHAASYDARLGESESARTHLEQALAEDPQDVYVVYWAAHTYECLGERAEALLWMRRALEMGYPTAEVLRDPFLEELTSDERFVRLMNDMQRN